MACVDVLAAAQVAAANLQKLLAEILRPYTQRFSHSQDEPRQKQRAQVP